VQQDAKTTCLDRRNRFSRRGGESDERKGQKGKSADSQGKSRIRKRSKKKKEKSHKDVRRQEPWKAQGHKKGGE